MMMRLLAWLRARWMKVGVVLGVSAALAAAGCAQLAEKERELTFRVVPGDASWFSGLPAGVNEMDLPVTVEGKVQRVHAWWWPAEQRGAPALLYLHGSRWNLTGQLYRIEQLHDFGYSVLAIDYRGFGRSDGGMPSEATVYEDARAGWERLTELEPDPAKRYIYGHSLGGAIAIDLAAWLSAREGPVPARGLIVESTFTSLADIARALSYEWLPVQWILSQKFDSIDKIAQVRLPVLVVHGEADRYVPARFSKMLYEAARGPKQLLLVEGGTHNNSMRMGSDDYRQALGALFDWPGKTPTTPRVANVPARRARPGAG
ncbi:MAG TPA: alpha/beta fold hydrolase [Casimicrobiaceae bacterium]|nr:alpha/beta fold hydrolase [Casimicrobiaceae bacterium]